MYTQISKWIIFNTVHFHIDDAFSCNSAVDMPASATGNDDSVTAFTNRYLTANWQRARVTVNNAGGSLLPKTITHALICASGGYRLC